MTPPPVEPADLALPVREVPEPCRGSFCCDIPCDRRYRRSNAFADGNRGVQRGSDVGDQAMLAHWLCASGRGDREAFRRVYDATVSRLFPIALRILRRRESAEDALQEAFILIWRKAAHFDPGRGRPMAWMATIVRNSAIDRLRVQTQEPRDPVDWQDAAEVLADPASVEVADQAPDALAVRGALAGLEENQRKAILLAYVYGMTHEELSACLGAPLGTVKSWVRRGLQHLKMRLEV